MNEFKNNKDSKLKELKSDIAKQKSALSKHAAELKILQKELQTASLELGEPSNPPLQSPFVPYPFPEQTEADIETSAQEVEEGKSGLIAYDKELKQHAKQQQKLQVRPFCGISKNKSNTSWSQESHDDVEAKLKKERADLTRFDEELNELDLVIKEKRQAVADAELKVKDIEHQIGLLQKERSAATHAVAALEKGNPWIEEDKQYVLFAFTWRPPC